MTRLATATGWERDVRRKRAGGTRVALLHVAPALVALVALAPVTPGGAVAAAVATAAAVAGWVAVQHRGAVKAAGARPSTPAQAPRIHNIARGLASDLGIEVPRILVAPAGGPNAMVAGGRHPALVVTDSLARTFTRTETEAVIAHCLARLAAGRLRDAARAAAFGPLLGGTALPVGTDDDLRAAGTTRYPPALVTALEKAEPREGRFAPFWFAGDPPGHEPAAHRIEALSDM